MAQVKYDCQKCGYSLGPFHQNTEKELHIAKCPACQSAGPFLVPRPPYPPPPPACAPAPSPPRCLRLAKTCLPQKPVHTRYSCSVHKVCMTGNVMPGRMCVST